MTVNSKGLITAASNETYLTGNQTINFSPTGDVTGSTSGTTTLAPVLTIDANKVTLSKLQQISSVSLLGRSTAGTGNVEVISIGTGLNLSGGVLSNAGSSGTVSSFTFTNGNGFIGSVSNSGTTPSLSLVLQNATTSQSGQLSNTDWNTFNNKQPLLNGTGFIKASGTTITYDSSTYLTSTTGAGLYQPLENQRLSTSHNVQFGNISGGTGSFTGSVTGITESLSDNSAKLASTAFVKAQGFLTSTTLATDPGVVHISGSENISGPKTFNNITTFGSGVSMIRRAVANTATTLSATDFLIAYTSLTATRAVTLPSATSVAGQHFVIKDESGSAGSFVITIVGTVDGVINPVAVNTAYGKFRIYSNGTGWFTE